MSFIRLLRTCDIEIEIAISITPLKVNDQSDPEAVSVSEKTDDMEKSRKLLDKEMPHEEIKQLHVYLLDMISQVDSLKDTIFQMKADQERTESDLKTKE